MPEKVKLRLSAYHQQTEPIKEHYKKKNEEMIVEINGQQSIEDVFNDIVKVLE